MEEPVLQLDFVHRHARIRYRNSYAYADPGIRVLGGFAGRYCPR